MKKAGFPKQERIISKKLIEQLFENGHSHSLTVFPLRAVYQVVEASGNYPVQILVSVSKRHFKHAVDRNRIKRQIREAYRLNKQQLQTIPLPQGQRLAIAFIWITDELMPSKRVTNSVITLLRKINERLRPTVVT
ncbi:MAG: ribonuclease P protein component [Prevotella sp.]|nr:ribonuclease P protein component [Prevotella sp.]